MNNISLESLIEAHKDFPKENILFRDAFVRPGSNAACFSLTSFSSILNTCLFLTTATPQIDEEVSIAKMYLLDKFYT